MAQFIARNGLIAQNNSEVTGSLKVTGGITGSLFGTASYASTSLSSSFALNATSSSFALSSSFSSQANSASFAITSSFATSSSFALNATSSSFATTASFATSSSFALSSSFSSQANSASFAISSSRAVSSSFTTTSSFALNAVTMTNVSGGFVPTPPNNTTTFLRGDGTFATPSGGGGGSTFIKSSSISLNSGSWGLTGSYYQYTLTNASIVSTGYVDFVPNNSSSNEISTCRLLPQIDTGTGSCVFYSIFQPQTSILGDLIIHLL